MTEKAAVLAAVEAVVTLNTKAGVNSKSLEALVKAVAEERGKDAFDMFCKELMGCIHGCFGHFSKVMPHLAKIRAHRDFHQARLQIIPAMWQSLTSSIGLSEMEPINLQSVSRELLGHCMSDLYSMVSSSMPSMSRRKEARMLADEENALRYSSGYIGMKLLKELNKAKGSKAAQFRECLSSMSQHGNDSSFYAYTKEWVKAVDRGC